MEKEEKVKSFLEKGTTCLFDSYLFPFDHNGVTYPSVRHALACMKTESLETRAVIVTTMLPSDLKGLMDTIADPSYWTPEFISDWFYSLNMKKFRNNLSFQQKLLEATDEDLIASAKGIGDYGFLPSLEDRKILIKIKNTLKSAGALFS